MVVSFCSDLPRNGCHYRQSLAGAVTAPPTFTQIPLPFSCVPGQQQQQLKGGPPSTGALNTCRHRSQRTRGIWDVCNAQGLTNDECRGIDTPAPLPQVQELWHMTFMFPRLPFGSEPKPPSEVDIHAEYSTLQSPLLPQLSFHSSVLYFHILYHIRGCFWETDLRHKSSLSIV